MLDAYKHFGPWYWRFAYLTFLLIVGFCSMTCQESCRGTAHADPVPAWRPFWEVYQGGRDPGYPDWARDADFYTVTERFPRYEPAYAAAVMLAHKHPGWAVDLLHIYGPETGQIDFIEYWAHAPDVFPEDMRLLRQIWYDPRQRCYDTDGGCTPLHRQRHPFAGRRP